MPSPAQGAASVGKILAALPKKCHSRRGLPHRKMSALTEVSEADELKAAVAATGEPRLIALLERLCVVEGKLAGGSGDLRAAIDAWNPPTSSGQAAKTRLAELLTRLEAVEAVEAAPSKVDPAVIAALKKELDNACMAHNFSPKRAGRPSNIEKDFQAFKERLNTKAVAPLNAIKNQGKEEGTVDPIRPGGSEVAAADKACRTAMRFMRKLDRLRGASILGIARPTPRPHQNAATAALEAAPRARPRRGARRRRRGAVGLRPGRAGRDRELGGAQVRGARRCEELNSAVEAAVTAVTTALAAHEGVERAAARSSCGAGPAAAAAALPRESWTSAAAQHGAGERLTTTNPRRDVRGATADQGEDKMKGKRRGR